MVDGLNLYTYVNNNPINFIDPWGLCKANNKFRIRTIAAGGGGFILGGKFITFEIERIATGKRQYYSYLGGGASFGFVTSGSGPSSWTEFVVRESGLIEQSFSGYVILKSATAKVGVGGGGFVLDWITGAAKAEEIPGIGWETGAAFGVDALHGVMWRR